METVRFPIEVEEKVRFADLDSFGHMNNSIYFTFFEQARVAFLRPHDADYTEMILARCEIDFRAQVSLGETVEIALTPTRVGTKSFELSYEMKVGERLVAEAKTVLVAYDYERSESRPLPEAWRKLLVT